MRTLLIPALLLVLVILSGTGAAGIPPAVCPYCGRTGVAGAVPFAVTIDNHPAARPPSGLNQACLVVEAPVEGGITRFLALFGHGQEVPTIGPVRSMRPYFVVLAYNLGAVLVHCGGSPEAYELAPTLNLPRLDEIRGGYRAFWRDKTRRAPHNLYTASARVQAEIRRQGLAVRALPQTPAAFAATPATQPEAAAVTLPYHDPVAFAPGPQGYVRTVRGVRQNDKAGAAITAANVIVVGVPISLADRAGRLRIPVGARYSCVVHNTGHGRQAFWSGERGWAARVTDTEGSPLALPPGLLWLALVPIGRIAPLLEVPGPCVRFVPWAD